MKKNILGCIIRLDILEKKISELEYIVIEVV